MPEMRRGTLRFAYRDAGSGPAFVFQHGLGADADQPASLAPRGYRLVTLECRGHGGTSLGPPDELGFETLARDLDTLLDELRLEDVAVVRARPGASRGLRVPGPAFVRCGRAAGPLAATGAVTIRQQATSTTAVRWPRSPSAAIGVVVTTAGNPLSGTGRRS